MASSNLGNMKVLRAGSSHSLSSVTSATSGSSSLSTSPATTATNNYFNIKGKPNVGSGIGTDVEMIAANHRQFSAAPAVESEPVDSGAEMKDEYGQMDDSGETYRYPHGPYQLESGQTLPIAELRYQTYGELNEARDNVLVVCHALTGNASLHSWWGDLLGPGRAFDTDRYFVVCCNILGSCYGSTNPTSINPETGRMYGVDFPDISVKDTVRLQLHLLKDELRVSSVKCVIGGSFGGMQTVEFAVQAGSPDADFTDDNGNPFVRSVMPIACGAQHTAWQIGVSEVQRQAIYKDPAWQSGRHFEATAGLEIARQLGMISYRTPVGYVNKFGRDKRGADSPPYGSNAKWQVKSYLEYQGSKFLSRFDPVTYVKMTEQMDSHDVARGREDGNIERVLQGVTIPALVLGIDSDVLYPLYEQELLARYLSNARLEIINSEDGHDGFLLEQDQVAAHIMNFLEVHQ